jgi:hypothetical protein
MSAIRFRAQWHWRIPAAQALGVQFPELDAATLGVLAGHVRRVPLSRLAGHHWCIATRRTATVIDRSVLAALADARV